MKFNSKKTNDPIKEKKKKKGQKTLIDISPKKTYRRPRDTWKNARHHPLFSSVQLLSRVRLFVTSWITVRQASLSITNSQSSLKLTSIESVMPSSPLILCHPLLLLPPIPPSITVFSNESTLLMRWPKYWSFSFSISPSNEHPGLISFRMDWLDLLALQGTLKSLLPTPQFKSINSSVLSLLYCPTLTSEHDYWKNHSFEYMDLGQPSDSMQSFY